MRLGLISDIHGNEIALDAVLSDGRDLGVDSWWVLGDLVALGPDPVVTLAKLRSLPNVRFVRGNTDRYVVAYDHDAVLERLEVSDHPEAGYIASFQRGKQVRHH